MSASAAVAIRSSLLVNDDHDEDMMMETTTTETAFSRIVKEGSSTTATAMARRRRRGAYGSAAAVEDTKDDDNKNESARSLVGDLFQDSNLFVSQASAQREDVSSSSLFTSNDNDDDSDIDDESTVDMNVYNKDQDVDELSIDVACRAKVSVDEAQASDDEDDEESTEAEAPRRGRTKRSFPSALESLGQGAQNTTPGRVAEEEPEQNDETNPKESQEEDAPLQQESALEAMKNEEVEQGAATESIQVGDETDHAQNEEEVLQKDEQPEEEALITSVDILFVHADKEAVTVRDIVLSLEAEYNVKLSKATKKVVKTRLTDLIRGNVEQSVEGPPVEVEEEGPHEESEDDAAGNDDDDESVSKQDLEEEASDYEEEVKPKKKNPRKKAIVSKLRKSTRKTQSKKKPSHVRIHAERLRKKRIEELRVRNEELQVQQSKQDQERAEQIAAKFETNTEEQRLKRLEDRLDLLQKLDQKRIRVVSIEEDDDIKSESKGGKDEAKSDEAINAVMKTEVNAVTKHNDDQQVPASAPTEESDVDSPDESGSDDSDDDYELEVIGKDVPSITTMQVPQLPKSSALSVLDRMQGHEPSQKTEQQRSPGTKSMSARAALRSALIAKQRKAGNMWLARELGYKTEQEHLRDCMLVEQQKRVDVVKKEQERLRANEHKQLRERLMTESAPFVDDEDEQEFEPENDGDAGDGNESDEEMAMAREIEEEQRKTVTTEDGSGMPLNDDGTEAPPADDEEDGSEVPPVCAHAEVTEPADEVIEGAGEQSENERAADSPARPSEQSLLSTEMNAANATSDDNMTVDSLDCDAARFDKPSERVETDESPGEAESSATDATLADAPNDTAFESVEKTDILDSKESTKDDDQEQELQDDPQASKTANSRDEKEGVNDRNAGWKAMLQKEAEKLKKMKARKNGHGLVEAEAEEEEEEEVAGLEDFGFSVKKKKTGDDEDDDDADKVTEEDMKHVVDDVSDDEGDEDAGEAARKEQEQKEEKERHKEIIRRMRDGYDGRRGGIAGGGFGARGNLRFDQLVAADNREDAKRLGLLNDDELDSDDEKEKGDDDEDEDENALLLDKMLKDRFLHRTSVDEIEENFSDDEQEKEETTSDKENAADHEEEKEQERLAKRFVKRARMQRLIELHGDDEEFSQLRLIDEDESTRLELKLMKSVTKKPRGASVGSSRTSQSNGSESQESVPLFDASKQHITLDVGKSSLSLALKASRKSKTKTSFLGGSAACATKEKISSVHSVAMGHVVFSTGADSQLSKSGHCSRSNVGNLNRAPEKRKRTTLQTSTSLWSKVSANGFKKRR